MAVYNSKKCVIDGHEFASETEGQRYRELTWLVRAGEISDLIVHPEFLFFKSFRKCPNCCTTTDISKKSTICPRCKTKMVTFKGMKYIGDFQYTTKEGKVIVEDVKGPETWRTDKFRLKERLFNWFYPDRYLTVITSRQIRK